MDTSSDELWVYELYENTKAILYKGIQDWAEIVNKLGSTDIDRKECAKIYSQRVQTFANDLVDEMQETYNNVLMENHRLLERIKCLCADLSMKMPNLNEGSLSLYAKEEKYSILIEKLESELNSRMEVINSLKERRDNISTILGREPFLISESPLPSASEIDNYSKRIEQMEAERHKRFQTFLDLKRDIQDIVVYLGVEPCLDFEKNVLYGDINTFQVTDLNMQMLKTFHESLVQQAEDVKDEISHLRKKLRHLLETMEEDLEQYEQFVELHAGYTLDTLDAFRKEVSKWEEVKKANIETFIKKLRLELASLWDKCGFVDAQRSTFEHFNDSLFTEDLLQLHEMEIERLKKYYEQHKNLYELLEKRGELLAKQHELEERANAPNRYKNRGGQLLKEEKQRNALQKRIPQIEENLINLAYEYEVATGHVFDYWGESIESLIQRSNELIDQEKKSKLSARKQQREITFTPGKSQLTAISAKKVQSSTVKRRSNLLRPPAICISTPSRSVVSLNKARATPRTVATTRAMTAQRSIRPPATPQQTNSKLLADNKQIGIRTVPSKGPQANMRAKLRYSVEKKKRLERVRRLSKLMKEKKTCKINNSDSDYENFEAEVTGREMCRSTFGVTPLSEVPQRRNTPKTKTAIRNFKEFKPTNLKLEF